MLLSLLDMARTKNFEQINTLPVDALTVTQYAKSINKHKSIIYHWINRGKADYSIKVFQGINFVIPNK